MGRGNHQVFNRLNVLLNMLYFFVNIPVGINYLDGFCKPAVEFIYSNGFIDKIKCSCIA